MCKFVVDFEIKYIFMFCDLWIVKLNINFNFYGNYYCDVVIIFFIRLNFVNWNFCKLMSNWYIGNWYIWFWIL